MESVLFPTSFFDDPAVAPLSAEINNMETKK